MFNKAIEIFKSGTHTDAANNTKVWTDAELQEFVKNHNPKKPAKIFLGHPKKADKKSYGKVDKLQFKKGVLLATFKNINPVFKEVVKSGEIGNRSIRAIKTNKGWELDHVGFLGISPPAVSDLAPIFQAPKDKEYHDYQFSLKTEANKNFIKILAEHIAEFINHKSHKGDKKMSKDKKHQFTQADIDTAVKEAQTKIKADFNAKLAQKLKAEKQKRKSYKFAKKVDKLVANGSITPSQSEGMAEFMAQLGTNHENEYQFTKGDKKVSVKASKWFSKFVSSLKSGVKTNQSLSDDGVETAQFSATQIAEYAKKHNVDPVTALEQLKKENESE